MHLVVIAWLFVILTMALTLTPLAGLALFTLGGLAPVALLAALLARRGRRAAGSMLEHEVRERDDGEAQADRR